MLTKELDKKLFTAMKPAEEHTGRSQNEHAIRVDIEWAVTVVNYTVGTVFETDLANLQHGILGDMMVYILLLS